MKIILLQDIKGVGRKYEEKNVSDGYAANKLLPQKLAVAANSPAAAQVRELMKQSSARKEKEEGKLFESLKRLSGTTVAIDMKANASGHLFASISAEKLAKLLSEKGFIIKADNILLEEPIKRTGAFAVPVSVGGGKRSEFTLEIRGS